jgi:hypothetical protein
VEEELEKDEDVKENTKKDLIYLNKLIKEETKIYSSNGSGGSSDNSTSTSIDSSGKEIIKPNIKIDLEKVT